MGVPPLLGVSILFFALADLWLAFPQIDLAVANLFATPEAGFAARGAAWEQLMYGSIEELLVIVGLGLIGTWVIGRWHGPARARRQADRQQTQGPQQPNISAISSDAQQEVKAGSGYALRQLIHRAVKQLTGSIIGRGRGVGRVTGRRLAFLLLLLTLVPGLLVNQLFKEHWGRARPIQLEQFGGNRSFSPAFVISDQGGGAFSSGHVAAAAWLVAVPVVLFGSSAIWTRLALLYLLAMVFARLAAGAHFLSDALTSILLVWLGFLILQRLIPLEPTGKLAVKAHIDPADERHESLLQTPVKGPGEQAT